MSKLHKIKLWFFIIFRILLIVAGIMDIYNKNWMNLVMSLLTLFVISLPSIIQKKFKIESPTEFDIAVLVFIFASIYLGEMHSFYYKFWWWDLFLHTFSGLIIGYIGFSLVYILNRETKTAIKLSPFFVCLFSFCFAIAIGTIWEIYEFFMDSIFGFDMQKSGLVDTMWDLIVDTLGALTFSVMGYLYLKGYIKVFKKVEKKLLRKIEM